MASGRDFGACADAYDRARPDYPEHVWSILVDRCGLGPGRAAFEVGPGTGLASRRLQKLGASPLVLIEPDPRFRPYLHGFNVVWNSFESTELAPGRFDLGVAATSFHWVDRSIGLDKAAALLVAGGYWAMAWNIHGGRGYEDPLGNVVSPVVGPMGEGTSPFTLDTAARLDDLSRAGFVDAQVEIMRWTHKWSARGARDLYSTFGRIMALPSKDRVDLLDSIEHAVATELGGVLERAMTTVVYTARRP